ncbi:hypothetical protein ACIA99_43725, partial [Amycolatopsis magusensis]
MSTTADHSNPFPADDQNHQGDHSVNTPAEHPDNTPVNADQNTTTDPAANGPANTTPDATDVAYTRSGNVVPIRPDAARTPADIPTQADVIDAEIVDEEAAVRPVLVDGPEVKRTWWETAGDATARPLVAKWLTSAEEFKSRVKFLVRYAAHATAFHALRVPVYVPTAILRSIGAIGRLVARLRAWVFDAESKPVRMAARDRADVNEYMRLREARAETVRRRMGPVILGLVVLTAIVFLCLSYLPPFWNWTLLLSALA